jgi:hypothetical protein
MRTWSTLALACVLLATGCRPTEPMEQPDPRLGQLVVVTDTAPAAVRRVNRADCAHDEAGTRYVLLSEDPGYAFGSAELKPGAVRVFRVGADGSTTEWPPAPVSVLTSCSPQRCNTLALTTEPGGLVIVDGNTDPDAPFVLHAAIGDGETWRTATLLPSHVARHERRNWRLGDQFRAWRSGVLVVQHANRLLRYDGSGWAPLPGPPGATSVRLGFTDADGVQVAWLDERSRLRVDVLNLDGSWRGPRRLTLAPAGFDFGPGLGNALSGTFDDFIVVLGSGTSRAVLAFHDGGWRQVASGTQQTLPWTDGLIRSTHPQRALSSDSGSVTGLVRGVDIGVVGRRFGVGGPETIGCEEACQLGPGNVAASEACRACVPRRIPVPGTCFARDASAVTHVVLDEYFDARRRVYLKSFPTPGSPMAQLTDSPEATGAWPAPGGEGTLTLGGTVWFRGAPLVGATITLTTLAGGAGPTQVSDGNGLFRFVGLDDTGWRVEVTSAESQPWTRDVAAGSGSLELVIQLHPTGGGFSVPRTARPAAALERQDLVVLRTEDSALYAWTRGQRAEQTIEGYPLDPADGLDVRFDGVRGLLGHRPAARGGLVTEVLGVGVLPTPLPSLDDVRATHSGAYAPDGPLDGITPRRWVRLSLDPSAPVEPRRLTDTPLVDVRPIGGDDVFLAWTAAGPGRTVVSRIGSPTEPLANTSVEPVPPLSRVGRVPVGSMPFWGLEGTDCGAALRGGTPCRLWLLRANDSTSPFVPQVVSENVIEAEWWTNGVLAVLEPTRLLLVDPAGAVRQVASGFTLPTEVPEEARWMLAMKGPRRVMVVTSGGLYSWNETTQTWREEAPAVRGLFPVQTGSELRDWELAITVQGVTGTSCATGSCRYGLLADSGSGTPAFSWSPALAGDDVRVSREGVLAAVASRPCPEDETRACTLLEFFSLSTAPSQPIGFGAFVSRPGTPTAFGLRTSPRGRGLALHPGTNDLFLCQ